MKTITAKEFLHILNEKGIDPKDLSQMVVDKLIEKGEKIATAESCTGGSISKRITDVSGASAVFDCGVCSYGNNIKNKVLGVKMETLETVGAVSPQTAMEMALGVRNLANSNYGIATTGIAGPTGGTKEKPVGLVYIGISSQKNTYAIKALLGEQGYNRENIRKIATDLALFSVYSEIGE